MGDVPPQDVRELTAWVSLCISEHWFDPYAVMIVWSLKRSESALVLLFVDISGPALNTDRTINVCIQRECWLWWSLRFAHIRKLEQFLDERSNRWFSSVVGYSGRIFEIWQHLRKMSVFYHRIAAKDFANIMQYIGFFVLHWRCLPVFSRSSFYVEKNSIRKALSTYSYFLPAILCNSGVYQGITQSVQAIFRFRAALICRIQ